METHDGEATDIRTREAEIIGKPQRIAPLAPEALTAEAHELSASIRASFGVTDNSTLPEVFATMLRHPGLFRAQIEMGIQLVANGTIPPRERELIILRSAWLSRAPYEWGEHVDIGKRYGVTVQDIERCTEGSTASGWSDHERAVIKGVEELHADHAITDETWDALAKGWSEQQLMEFPVLVGQYLSTALLQNSLRIRLAADNPGLSHR
jgi:alkylhydroperoxidase family enzyme